MESNIMMMKDRIREMESANDEQTIHLYYDEKLGQYVAFGLSAYYTTIVSDPDAVYSDELDMPMVRLKEQEVQALRHIMIVIEHEQKAYYRLKLHNKVGRRWYHTWIDAIIKSS